MRKLAVSPVFGIDSPIVSRVTPEMLKEACRHLNERELGVITRRYGAEEDITALLRDRPVATLAAIASEFGVSIQRVYRVGLQANSKVRFNVRQQLEAQ